MGIVCCICGKKQSGLFEDFSLSKEHLNLRICAACHTKMMELEKDINKEKAIKYFNGCFAEGMHPTVADVVQKKIAESYENNNTEPQKQPNSVAANSVHSTPSQMTNAQQFVLPPMPIQQTQDNTAIPATGNTNWNRNRNVSETWTKLARLMVYVSIALSAILGGAIAGLFDEELIFWGVIIGFVMGFVSATCIMVIIEMADNLKNLLKNSNELLVQMKNENNKRG